MILEQAVTKRTVAIHVLLTRSLFGDCTSRRLLLARFSSETDFLLLCNSDGCAQRSLNVGSVRTLPKQS